MKNIIKTTLFLLVPLLLCANEEIALKLANERLAFIESNLKPHLEYFTHDEQVFVRKEMDYINTLLSNPSIINSNITENYYSSDIVILHNALSKALLHDHSDFVYSSKAVDLCSPVYWGIQHLIRLDPVAAQILLRDYLVPALSKDNFFKDDRLSLIISQQLDFVLPEKWTEKDFTYLLIQSSRILGDQQQAVYSRFLRRSWYTRPEVLLSIVTNFLELDVYSLLGSEFSDLPRVPPINFGDRLAWIDDNFKASFFNLLTREGLISIDASLNDPKSYAESIHELAQLIIQMQ